MLLVSTTISDTPRYLYYAYLGTLRMLADLAGTSVDLFALPTVMELNLPKNGTYGMQLDISESLLSLEFTFENNPLDFMLGSNGLVGAAVTGILAAVSIPAYNDYIKRAQIIEAVILLAEIKTPAAEFFAISGRLPEIEEIGGVTSGKYTKNIRLLDKKNGYSAEFKNPPGISGKLIFLYDAETQTWTCTHEDMPEKDLPRNCK
ncbi:PilA-related fimbrial protein [Candidatus Thiomargarita nelsonii]|uniref:PilA-related fimbrial protein n=1 Tax=Candidatus Thiomargarita nelsonii TaxID=1003181 RepID=A0A176S2V2_9GAMM|nr:PilA-related fimbrial protein [Candidatus Thiomargarita nelsonii]